MTIYFIGDGSGSIKIGFVSSPKLVWKRLGLLQCGNASQLSLLGAIDGDISLESELHRRFASQRIRGEWFRESDELLELIPKAERGRPRLGWHSGDVGRRSIEEWTERTGLNRHQLSRISGITESTLSRIASGHSKKITPAIIEKLNATIAPRLPAQHWPAVAKQQKGTNDVRAE